MINNYINIDEEILILNESKKEVNEEIRNIDKINHLNMFMMVKVIY